MPSGKNLGLKKSLPIKTLLIMLIGGVGAVSIYLITAEKMTTIGFPLDDAWIHQVYARSLGTLREWSFRPGVTSAGSTAPGWTFLLSLGYLFSTKPAIIWTYLLGTVFLLVLSGCGYCIIQKEIQEENGKTKYILLIFLLEWHLVWAAVSGMETIFASAIIMFFFALLKNPLKHPFWTGFVSGVGIWTRPDLLTLAGPLLFVLLIKIKLKPNWKKLLLTGFGFLLPISIYLIFNYLTAGTPWPNTFYAKQAEYAVLLEQPLIKRFVSLSIVPLTGVGALLLPGWLYAILYGYKKRDWWLISTWLWSIGFVVMYALKLPATYQHGRYIIPVISVFITTGLLGSYQILKQLGNPIKRVSYSTIVISAILIQGIFFIRGAQAYATDVGIIETEMVSTARWVEENTDHNDVIAAHDIGALGFFTSRPIVDLAGLISPEVIPIIRNEDMLLRLIREKNATYLVTFPNWYPNITGSLELVYSTSGGISPASGGENMSVYSLK